MQERPSMITRAVIDAAVDRGLRDIEEDPERTVRKLTDLVRMCSRGRLVEELYGMVQDLLRNDNSPYYTAIDKILRNTSRENLTEFGTSLGHSSLSFGSAVIRMTEEKEDFRIPWNLILRLDARSRRLVSLASLQSQITQAMDLGIYCFTCRIMEQSRILNTLLPCITEHPECAFFVLFPDETLDAQTLQNIARCPNLLSVFPAFTASCDTNLKALKKQRSLTATYSVYNDDNAAEWYENEKAASLVSYDVPVHLMVADDSCSAATCKKVDKYCSHLRVHPKYPVILFDVLGDTCQISKIVTGHRTYLEFTETGRVRIGSKKTAALRPFFSLEDIFRHYLPRNHT